MPDAPRACPECGEDLTDKPESYIRHHADYHWNHETENRYWSREAWERRRQLLSYAGSKLPAYDDRG